MRRLYCHLCIGALILHQTACDRVKRMEEPECYAPAVSCDGGDVPGERLVCLFGLDASPIVDGNLSDGAWKNAKWQQVDYTKVPEGESEPDGGNADASFKIACVADMHNLYFGFEINDDVINPGGTDDHTGSGTHDVDSLEIYLDQCRGKHTLLVDSEPLDAYNGDDIQLIIEAENVEIGTDDRQQLIGPGQPRGDGITVGDIIDELDLRAASNASGQLLDNESYMPGWHGEIRIPACLGDGCKLNIVPAEGRVIGFQIGYNDSDSGNSLRDNKLLWGKDDRKTDVVEADSSYLYPSRFGDLVFCKIAEK